MFGVYVAAAATAASATNSATVTVGNTSYVGSYSASDPTHAFLNIAPSADYGSGIADAKVSKAPQPTVTANAQSSGTSNLYYTNFASASSYFSYSVGVDPNSIAVPLTGSGSLSTTMTITYGLDFGYSVAPGASAQSGALLYVASHNYYGTNDELYFNQVCGTSQYGGAYGTCQAKSGTQTITYTYADYSNGQLGQTYSLDVTLSAQAQAQNGTAFSFVDPVFTVADQNLALVTTNDAGNTLAPVPEPGEWAMMAAGLGLVGGIARRREAIASRG